MVENERKRKVLPTFIGGIFEYITERMVGISLGMINPLLKSEIIKLIFYLN
mgnify:CR=1 FL=1